MIHFDKESQSSVVPTTTTDCVQESTRVPDASDALNRDTTSEPQTSDEVESTPIASEAIPPANSVIGSNSSGHHDEMEHRNAQSTTNSDIIVPVVIANQVSNQSQSADKKSLPVTPRNLQSIQDNCKEVIVSQTDEANASNSDTVCILFNCMQIWLC